MKRFATIVFIVLTGFHASRNEAQAGLIVSNLVSTNVGQFSWGNPDLRVAAPFRLDPTFTPVDLGSVSPRLAFLGFANFATLTAGLWSDDGTGLPGALLMDLGSQVITSSTYSDYSFAPLSTFTLQPGTNYWFVLKRTESQGIIGWANTAGGHLLDPTGDPAATIPAATSASAIPTSGGLHWTSGSNEKLFSVQSTPEPAAGTLLVLGLFFCKRVRSAPICCFGR